MASNATPSLLKGAAQKLDLLTQTHKLNHRAPHSSGYEYEVIHGSSSCHHAANICHMCMWEEVTYTAAGMPFCAQLLLCPALSSSHGEPCISCSDQQRLGNHCHHSMLPPCTDLDAVAAAGQLTLTSDQGAATAHTMQSHTAKIAAQKLMQQSQRPHPACCPGTCTCNRYCSSM